MTGSIKTRPSKTKMFHLRIYPHYLLYHIPLPKSQKEFFSTQKLLRILKLLRVFIERDIFRFESDRVVFRFSIERILLIGSSVIAPLWCLSSESVVIDFSLGSSVLFFRHATISLSNRATTFFLSKTDSLFYFVILKKKFVLNN